MSRAEPASRSTLSSTRTPRAIALVVALCALLAACAQETDPSALTPAQEVEAAALLRDYEAARGAGNWLGAEGIGDRLRQRFPDSDAAGKANATLAEVRVQAEAVREAQRLAEAWSYQLVAVDGGEQRSALIDSRVPAAEEGETPSPADAQLVLRQHPEWGRSSYLLLQQRAFNCGKPCRLRIAFDAAPATEWAGKQADSGSGPALFVEDDGRFIAALRKAKTVRIELPAGSGRLKALNFDVAGYRHERFEPAQAEVAPASPAR
jgi:hypothetical protein